MHLDVKSILRGGIVLVVPFLLLEAAPSGGALTGPLFPNPVIGIWAGGIVVGDFDEDGKPDLAISRWNGGDVVIEPGKGDATFAPERHYPVGSGPRQLVAGDFNGDGHQDLAVVNEGASPYVTPGEISILLGLGDGSFAPEARLAVGNGPRGITVGDFNGDGRQDLAVINVCSASNGCATGEISVFIGAGDGTFAPATSYLAAVEPISIVSGDFNSDGYLDLIVGSTNTHYPATPSELSLLLGNGDGTFGAEIPTGAPYSGSGPIAVGDFNADGRPDLAVSGFFGSSITIFIGHGDGTFQESSLISGRRPFGIEIGDFNGDGHQDVATADQQSDDVSVFLGHGDGTFANKISVAAGNGAGVLAFGDLDVDGRLDLVVGNETSQTVLIRIGNADGSFGAGARQLDSFDVQGVALADFNRDGKPDLVVPYAEFGPIVPNGDLSVLLGDGDGTFGPELHLGGNVARGQVVTGDFNADGKPDFAVGNRQRGNISIFLGRGDGTFGAEMLFAAGSDPSEMASGDLDGDGVLDLVVVNQAQYYPSVAGDLSVLIGRGDGTFAPEIRLTAGTGPESATLADYNGDGRLDLAVVNEDNFGSSIPGYVLIFLGRGDGTFSSGSRLDAGPDAFQAVARDFNGDGRLDLVVDNRGVLDYGCLDFCGGDLSLFLGNGDGTFRPQVRLSTGGSPLVLVAADVDGDGKVDLLTANVSFDISILFGHGDGTFANPARFGVQGFSQALAAADFDGDGLIDLVGIGFSALTVLPQRPPPDRDGDGVLNPADNCPTIPNPGQEDGDGLGNLCDNCPAVANPGQQDADHNGLGDACDACTDLDHDGFGEPGLPVSTCPVDNCPTITNSDQSDADGDGLGDACDSCTDRDGDGLGDPGFPNNTCAIDNCPSIPNPTQADADHDGLGDVCDNCVAVPDHNQSDLDADGVGDICDNCPAAANPGQEDANADGSGNACQPVLTLYGLHHSGDKLQVVLSATDPQDDPLSSTVEIFDVVAPTITLPDSFASGDCSQGYLPGGVTGEGIGFANGAIGAPYLFDLDSVLYCHDYAPDYLIALGTCEHPETEFNPVLSLTDVVPPAAVCLRRIGDSGGGLDLTILTFDLSTLVLSVPQPEVLKMTFDHGLPAQVDISGLVPGRTYRLRLTVTDGTTVPVAAEETFVYQGESRLVFTGPNSPPHASIFPAATVECTGPAGGVVRLDGSGSTDADSTPGTSDDIVSFDWFENPGQPGEVVLGSGRVLSIMRPLGMHVIGLVVTDSKGATDAAQITATVQDTMPPQLALTLSPTVLWPPNHRMVPVRAAWQVSDVCDPVAQTVLVSVTSSEPDDAPGNGDGNTAGDIQDTSVGTADSTVLLRAERAGGGPGRFYTLTYAATDASGNTASALGIVSVPHDQGTGPEPVMLSVEGGGTPGMAHLYWNAVGGAEMYDVIQGDLSQVSESNGEIRLGPVRVLASGQPGASYSEGPGGAMPAAGRAFFYLVQYRQGQSASGWGTESSPWPAEPSSCDIGCPGEPVASSAGSPSFKK